MYVPDEQGNTILDSSHAGYGGGGVPIPTVPVKETIWPVAGDNTEHVQAAIDRISALPLDKNGFRGALVLRAGDYRMATPIIIKASGVVLRGEGMGDTGTILIGTGTGRPAAAAPAGGAARQIKAVCTIEGLDRPTKTITVKGPAGRLWTARVADTANLTKMHIGETVVITLTEAAVVSLEKAPKKAE